MPSTDWVYSEIHGVVGLDHSCAHRPSHTPETQRSAPFPVVCGSFPRCKCQPLSWFTELSDSVLSAGALCCPGSLPFLSGSLHSSLRGLRLYSLVSFCLHDYLSEDKLAGKCHSTWLDLAHFSPRSWSLTRRLSPESLRGHSHVPHSPQLIVLLLIQNNDFTKEGAQ